MKLHALSAVLLLSTGCGIGLELMAPSGQAPFEIDSDEPVDTGLPPEGDADVDADADADADSDADSDADTDPVQPSAPELYAFSLSEDSITHTIQGSFVADAADGNLYGGAAVLELDGDRYEIAIPSDLDSFSSGGTSTFSVSSNGLLPGDSITASLVVEDDQGLRSGRLNENLVLAGFNTALSEPDDDYGSANDVGRVEAPGYLVGNISRASNDGVAYTGDMDFLAFRLPTAARVTFTLTWDAAAADYDLRLGDRSQWLDTAITDGTTQPEVITYNLQANTTYYLAIAGWSGPSGDYEVTLVE